MAEQQGLTEETKTDYNSMAEQKSLITEDEKKENSDSFLIESTHEIVTCGLEWDFFGQAIDLDVTVVATDVYSLEMDAAYYNQTNILNDSIIHSGDNKDGVGDGDDEEIQINLKKLPAHCYSLWFLVNAYSGGSFKDVETARFKFYDSNKKILHSYSIAMAGYTNTAMLLGVLYRDVNEQDWHYKKVEKAGKGLNFVESKEILENNLCLIYSAEILDERPRDRTKTYELKKSESYVIDPSIERVTLGLGWDPAKSSQSIDVDGSIIIYDKLENSDKIQQEAIVSYSNLSYQDSIKHHGDNLTGDGDGDDEEIDMYLNKMGSDKIDILCIVINIYKGANSFKSIKNCFARLVDDKGKELCRFTLTGNQYNKTGMIMCTINKKKNGCWGLNAVGMECTGRKAQESAQECKNVCIGIQKGTIKLSPASETTQNQQNQENIDNVNNSCCCIVL